MCTVCGYPWTTVAELSGGDRGLLPAKLKYLLSGPLWKGCQPLQLILLPANTHLFRQAGKIPVVPATQKSLQGPPPSQPEQCSPQATRKCIIVLGEAAAQGESRRGDSQGASYVNNLWV